MIIHLRSIYVLMLGTVLCVVALSQERYSVVPVTDGGTVRGTVRLAPQSAGVGLLPITKNEEVCGRTGVSPRLAVGRNSGVHNAVVYLERIAKGKAGTFTLHPKLNQQGCEYRPHILLAPVGAQLEIVNSDPILHNIHAYEGVGTLRSLCNIAQPIKGQSTTLKEMEFTKPGLVSFSCDAGHPWMSAYLLVVQHPYYCVTDDNGKFTLADIPPGTYTLKVWHEGVKVKDRLYDRSVVMKYSYEDPYELSQTVVVGPGKHVTADFALQLREESMAGSSHPK